MSQTYCAIPPSEGVPPHRRRSLSRILLTLGAAMSIACLPAGSTVGQVHHTTPATERATAPTTTVTQTILGDVIPVGDGTARSWIQLDATGNPTAVGLTLTEAALTDLPADVTPGMIWMAEYLLAFPPEIEMLPFNHIGLNWNPKGHIPNGIYDVPHFDVHFYTISPQERMQITARGADLEKCRKVPVEGHVPDGYILPPDTEEPGMGAHWVDPISHEFHGQAFTSTFLYGTYDGAVIFYEPMITKAYLESKPDTTMHIKVPSAYARAGYYPTSYTVRYDPQRKEYVVALEGLTLRRVS